MSSFNKIKYSFVLCLALLFSFSFAGTISINSKSFDVPLINGTYVISANTTMYDLSFQDSYLQSKPCYLLKFYDETRLNDFVFYGLQENYEGGSTAIFPLYETFTNYYDYAQPYYCQIYFFLDGTFFGVGNGLNNLSSSSFPLNITSGTYIQTIDYYAYYDDIDFLHLSTDVYEYDFSTKTIGDLVIDTETTNPYPPFTTSMTHQQINDTALMGLDSLDVFNDLPSNYTNFFIQHDEENNYNFIYFFPSDVLPYGYIWNNKVNPVYYQIYFNTKNSSFGKKEFNIYCFSQDGEYNQSLGDTPYHLLNIVPSSEFSHYQFDFNNIPVVYSFVNFPFYFIKDGVQRQVPDFIVSPFNIENNQGQTVTADDVLSQPKTIDSVWSVVNNILNPPTTSNSETSNISSIEQQHDSILDHTDNQSFFDMFNNSKDLITSITSVTWLITASQLMFNYFSSFLVLCCVFITISRVMR